jgi:hypothetical protein
VTDDYVRVTQLYCDGVVSRFACVLCTLWLREAWVEMFLWHMSFDRKIHMLLKR